MKNNKKEILLIVITIVLVLISCGIVIKNFKYNKETLKSVKTVGQVLSENIYQDQMYESTDKLISSNEIDGETNPIDENIVDENKRKESEVNNEKEIIENTNKYYVKINNTANVVNIYTKDANGNYTVPFKAMVCSIGTSTPKSGKYKLSGTKHRWHTLFGHKPGTYVYGQYTTSIVGNILFHSVPYTINGDPSSLEYLEYDKLGTKASAGCIRLTVQDAKWIFNNITKGTIIEFYNDSNPGPLGKPCAKKISGNIECRGWDPTDLDSRNPWRNTNAITSSSQSSNITENKQQSQGEAEQQKPENSKTDLSDKKDELNKSDNSNVSNKEDKNNSINVNNVTNNIINNIQSSNNIINK